MNPTDPISAPPPRYTLEVDGPPALLRAADDAFAAVMIPFLDDARWVHAPDHLADVPALRTPIRRSSFGGLEPLGVVIGFIGTYLAKKVFDEVYERVAKRPIGAMLDRILGDTTTEPARRLEYRDVVYLQDIDLVIVVRVAVDPPSTTDLARQVMQAHGVALAYVAVHGRQAPIHCHPIVDGNVSLQPELFTSLEDLSAARAATGVPHRRG